MQLGVKRKYWFGYKFYEISSFYFRGSIPVRDHKNETQELKLTKPWLVLKLASGSQDVILNNVTEYTVIYDQVEPKPSQEGEE